jgi:hypothetical protein
MKIVPVIVAAALLAGVSASSAATAPKYYVVLTDVFASSVSNFAGPYASKAACESDKKAFQARDSMAAVYLCEVLKKSKIDALSDEDRQSLQKTMLNTK